VEILYSSTAADRPSGIPCTTAGSVGLQFKYSLAKFKVMITGGVNSELEAADFDDMTVSVEGMYTKAKLQLTDGSFTDYADMEAITLHKTGSTDASATFEALALPVTGLLSGVRFVFNVAGRTYGYDAPPIAVAAGILYTFNLSLDFPEPPSGQLTQLSASINQRDTEVVNISTNPGFNFLNQTKFSLTGFSSEDVEGSAASIIDGNPGTYWSTSEPLPQSITIDMNNTWDVHSIRLVRPASQNYTKTVEMEGSTDNLSWSSLGTLEFTDAAADIIQILSITAGTQVRYLRMTVTDSYASSLASLCELYVSANL
jgi:hypothetical protein